VGGRRTCPARSTDTGSASATGNATDLCAGERRCTSGCIGIWPGNTTAADAAADKALGEIGFRDQGGSGRRRTASGCPKTTGGAGRTWVLYCWAGRIGGAGPTVWTTSFWTVIVTETETVIEIETETGTEAGVSCQDQNYCRVLPSNLALSHRSDPTPISTIPTWH